LLIFEIKPYISLRPIQPAEKDYLEVGIKSSMRMSIKWTVSVLLITAAWLAFALSNAVTAESIGPSAIGKFEILNDDGPTRLLQFSALATKDGQTFGEVVFQDAVGTHTPKIDNSSDFSSDAQKQFFLRAKVDCLVVKDNRAVMSGNVTESSFERYIGRRFLVVTQDNGDGLIPAQRDKISYGIYRPTIKNWYATDEERPEEGVGPLSWLATDLERPEDEGRISSKDETVGCQTFSLSSFSFVDAKHGRGSVQVRP
jgi:hypothetical protein